METVYRDYGAMGPANIVNELVAPLNEFNIDRRRLVYLATHRGDGTRLPFMNRSFISFTYGGKAIEDFDLIATIVNNRMSKDGYAQFNDLTTTYDVLDGQSYWGTHYTTNTILFVLSTDGIDQKTLDDFLYWFHPGEAKELILSEHINRAILARVALPPQLSLLPFELNDVILIANVGYNTKTTLYKGDITLELVMDSPHWYAKTNLLGKEKTVVIDGESKRRYVDVWDDPLTNQEVSIFASKEALKILLEDGIPLGSMILDNMLLGNGAYAIVEGNEYSLIWNPETSKGAKIAGQKNGVTYYGMIAGPIIDANGGGIESLPAQNLGGYGYFYYTGTAPSPTIISFTLTPEISGEYYIMNPTNSYVNSSKPYNSFIVESKNIAELRFTTPNLYTSYNKVIELFKTHVKSNTTCTWEDLRAYIRNEIRHEHVRAWAIKLINTAVSNNTLITNASASLMCIDMLGMLKLNSNSLSLPPVTFTFNSETGEAKGTFQYHQNASDTISTVTEDVGDMLCSNFIVIRDRNYPTDAGFVIKWSNNNKTASHRIYHDSSVPLTSLLIQYRNMYL